MRLRLLVLLVSSLLPFAASATTVGFGYGYRLNQVDLPAHTDGRVTYLGFSGLVPAHVISLYDATGILAAALGTAGNEAMAKERALEAAARDPSVRAGDSVSYSYENVPPAPGLLTTVELSFGGSGPLTATFADGTPREQPTTVGHFGFLFGVGMWSAPIGPLTFGLDISALAQLFELKPEHTYKADPSRVHFNVGGGLSFDLPFNLLLSAKIDFAVTSLLYAAFGYPQWLDFTAAARVGWRPVPIVYAFVEGGYGKAGLGDVTMTVAHASANVALLFDLNLD